MVTTAKQTRARKQAQIYDIQHHNGAKTEINEKKTVRNKKDAEEKAKER